MFGQQAKEITTLDLLTVCMTRLGKPWFGALDFFFLRDQTRLVADTRRRVSARVGVCQLLAVTVISIDVVRHHRKGVFGGWTAMS